MHVYYLLQVGVVNFEPYQDLFLSLFSHSRTSFSGALGIPSMFGYPARNYKTASLKDYLPALGIKLQLLKDRLKVSHELPSFLVS